MTLMDLRQTIYRGILQQLIPWLSGQTGLNALSSIDQELTPPLVVTASSTPSLTIDIGAATVTNNISNRSKSATFLGTALPIFAGGTITLPASPGPTSNISASTGGLTVLDIPVSQYVYILLSVDENIPAGIITTVGTPNAILANAIVPSPVTNTLPFAYFYVYNNAGGNLLPVAQSAITQLAGGGGGNTSALAGTAAEVNLSPGSTSITVTLGTPRSSAAYIVTTQMKNAVDLSPQFQPLTITNKTAAGFTVTWDNPIDSANYYLGYIIPSVQAQIGEISLSAAATSVTVILPIAESSSSYVVIAEMINYIDVGPMFQNVVLINKTPTQFTVLWNQPLDTANYKLSFQAAAFA